MNRIALSAATALTLLAPALALAETTGPGATLFKLDDRWVSIMPGTETVVAQAPTVVSAPVVAVAPAPIAAVAAASIPGYTPDANYSGACHVTVDIAGKTYVLNATSSSDMVAEVPAGKVCLPSERLARDYGFSKTAR